VTYQPFLIANPRVGQETDIQPWILPNDAFPELLNAYLYRGVIRKKGGTELLGRLGVRQDSYPFSSTLVVRSGAPQTYAGNTLTAPIEPGSLIITDGVTTFTDNGLNVMAVTAGSGNAGTINYTTGAYSVTFTAANNSASVTATYIRQVDNNSPCMGLCTYEIKQINNNSLIGFDLTNAYLYNNGLGAFQDISRYKVGTGQTTAANTVTWTGTNSQFFGYENFQNAFFETNNVAGSNFYAATAVTTGATTQITTSSANNFQAGDIAYFNNFRRTVAGVNPSLNTQQGVVTVPGNPFTVSINTTGDTYTANDGIVWSQTLSKSGARDGIRWYDGTGWANFAPPLSGAGINPAAPVAYPDILQGALMLFAYKGRLVALNTFEGQPGVAPTNFAQRARYSQAGNVFYAPPFPTGGVTQALGNEWYESPGLGGAEDAPTSEVIVSAEFIKDVLVVYFERSTYKLVGSNNSARPFQWEKINTEIGAESTFSVVPFDKEILSIGSNGVYECDSINIDRVDQKIPDQVFNFSQENNGIARIHGIRDYYTQFCYWTYVDGSQNSDGDFTTVPVFPNSLLVYNYVDSSWATFENYFTCFGYYQTYTNLTWGNCTRTWDQMTVPWNSATGQTQFPEVIAGNQQGFVVYVNLVSASNNEPQGNDVSLVIQNITSANPSVFTSPNHNIDTGAYVLITGTGIAALDGNIFLANPITSDTFYLYDSNLLQVSVSGYTFGGFIQTVENFEIQTKKFTPFIESGQKMRVGYVDIFLEVDADDDGEEDDPPDSVPAFSAFLYENENYTLSSFNKIIALDNETGSALETKFWKRVYLNQTSQSFSLVFTYTNPDDNPGMTDTQIFQVPNVDTQVAIHGMIFWIAPAGRLVR
jgi:hypothetical protein